MFMLAVIAVLVVASVSFNILSRHHFRMLDQQVLSEKLESTKYVLLNAASGMKLDEQLLQLGVLFGSHQNLSAAIFDSNDNVLFSDPKFARIPDTYKRIDAKSMWEWQGDVHSYRGITSKILLNDRSEPLTVVLMLDITSHTHFFNTLQRWFGIALIISALISAGLGWIVARSGLKPVRQITQMAISMSAKSLQERIPLEPVPLELQELILSFNGMLARLENAFVRLSNFSADIAHELRTPLTNLQMQTEVVLSRKRNTDAYEENLYSNLEDLKRMSRMIDDMLFLAKADNGLIIPEQANIELERVISKLFDYYQFLAEERGIQLSLKGHGVLRGDRLMIDRAVSNILSNALRYTPEQGEILVEIQQSSDKLSLVIKNEGASIEAKHLEKLFDRFYRVDPARREGNPSNAGLGLAITRSIIEAHKGQIWCTSAEGLTAFHMVFPAAIAH